MAVVGKRMSNQSWQWLVKECLTITSHGSGLKKYVTITSYGSGWKKIMSNQSWQWFEVCNNNQSWQWLEKECLTSHGSSWRKNV